MHTTYVGIDLHKRSSTWVALAENGRDTLFTQEFPVTPEAIARGIALSKRCGETIVAAIEPVCGWRWVVPLLEENNIEVHVSNPRKVRAIADSLQKTDENDATMLAQLCRTGLMHESMKTSDDIQRLRSLVRERVFLVNKCSSMKCRLEGVLTRDGRHRIHGSPFTRKGNVALRHSGEAEWQRTLDCIADITKHIKTLDTQIAHHGKGAVSQLLMTIPGVGPVTAVSLLAEVGDYALFPSPRKLCAFAGLVPTEKSSGGTQKLGHITHAGSTVLRYVLVEAAMRIRDTGKNAAKCAVLYDFYKEIEGRRGKMRARVALARKILTISWYMVTRNEPYQQRVRLPHMQHTATSTIA
jgi:transposase